jgi:phosphorylcholine metabolism protein LicD
MRQLINLSLLIFLLLASSSQVATKKTSPLEDIKPDPQPRKQPLKAGKVVDPKYFHEAGGDEVFGHYDNRFFKGLVEYDDHSDSLKHLIRSYLTTLNKHGVETWLAHGTLLGWWWNGRIMPWDYDLDVQVSSPTLYWLGKNLNHTKHNYEYVNRNGTTTTKQYMLDVNPYHINFNHGDGQNVIDARWIDMSNGMFIDITSLAERDPQRAPGIWSCKNYHRYRTIDLYPMRQSEFEGVPATVPYSFERILTEEYGMKSLVITEWEGYVSGNVPALYGLLLTSERLDTNGILR